MKFLMFSILMIFSQIMWSQEFKVFTPEVKALDFGVEAQAEWAVKDKAMKALNSGEKSWEELSQKEKTVFEKYGEVYKDMWDIVGEGCSWYCGGGPREVTASSYLQSQGSNIYIPKNAHDLSYKNAWVEGVKGYGIGEFLIYEFAPESPRVTDIIVVNGYVKSESSWRANSRVKKLKVYYNDTPVGILLLEDRIAEQKFKIGQFGKGNRADFEELKKEESWTLKFEILEVYKGDKYDDTVISEIFFDGIDVH
ncbi:NADase-type glycan-binding domain-containing protein [Ekhidna sp.]